MLPRADMYKPPQAMVWVAYGGFMVIDIGSHYPKVVIIIIFKLIFVNDCYIAICFMFGFGLDVSPVSPVSPVRLLLRSLSFLTWAGL